MKKYIHAVTSRVNFWNLFIGIVIGIGVGFYAMNALIPNGDEMLRMHRLDPSSLRQEKMMRHMGHSMNNPYMMNEVTSEQQFLKDMVLHHEAAVIMAQQVLNHSPSDKVKALAEAIIKAQTQEIADMKSWMTAQ